MKLAADDRTLERELKKISAVIDTMSPLDGFNILCCLHLAMCGVNRVPDRLMNQLCELWDEINEHLEEADGKETKAQA
jgi:hypothetical protein